jgi:hypothetical protein
VNVVELQHYIELEDMVDMVDMVMKMERKIKRRGNTFVQTNSASSSSVWSRIREEMGLPNQSLLSLQKSNHLILRFISVKDYSMTFNLRWKRRNNTKRMKNERGQQ